MTRRTLAGRAGEGVGPLSDATRTAAVDVAVGEAHVKVEKLAEGLAEILIEDGVDDGVEGGIACVNVNKREKNLLILFSINTGEKTRTIEFQQRKISVCALAIAALEKVPYLPKINAHSEINDHPEISAHQKTAIFKGGSTQNRWVVMGDFSKGGVHKTDGFR